MQKALINWISDLLWPHRCLGCRLRGIPLCLDCLNAIPVRPARSPLPGGLRVWSGGTLDAPLLSAAVWHLKYRNMPSLATPLASWLAGALGRIPEIAELVDPLPLVVPVPLHARRFRERGYNQAELLARSLAGIAALPTAIDALVRVRHTAPQVGSTGRSRIANMADAFSCTKPNLVHGRSILLVDDVCTTGATLSACASTLTAAGARTVTAVVLARV